MSTETIVLTISTVVGWVFAVGAYGKWVEWEQNAGRLSIKLLEAQAQVTETRNALTTCGQDLVTMENGRDMVVTDNQELRQELRLAQEKLAAVAAAVHLAAEEGS